MAMSIELKQVTVRYGKRVALDNLSLSISGPGMTAVLGPNGSGKTTLIKTILLPQMSAGELCVNDSDARMAVVSQAQDLCLSMRVCDYIFLGRLPYIRRFQWRYTKKDDQAVKHAMMLTDTTILKDRYLTTLSAGEQQRVHVARALAQEPTILLLDEPVSHLDLYYQQWFMDLMRQLVVSQQMTIVIVLHDVNLAASWCSDLIFLKQGSCVAQGSPQHVMCPDILHTVYELKPLILSHPKTAVPYALWGG